MGIRTAAIRQAVLIPSTRSNEERSSPNSYQKNGSESALEVQEHYRTKGDVLAFVYQTDGWVYAARFYLAYGNTVFCSTVLVFTRNYPCYLVDFDSQVNR